MSEGVLVLLRDGTPLPVPALAAPLAEALGLPRADVARALRHARGVLDLPALKARVRAAAEVLRAAGHDCRVVPRGEVPRLPSPIVLNAVRFGSDALDADQRGGGRLRIPWGKIGALVAGEVHLRHEPTLSSILREEPTVSTIPQLPGLPGFVAPGPSAGCVRLPPRRPREEDQEWLDIVVEDGYARLRILGGGFDYSCLVDRISLSSHTNFPLLTGEISRWTRTAFLSGTVLMLLEGKRLPAYRFPDPETFDAYARWASAWSRIFV